jgi:hypothetical protein
MERDITPSDIWSAARGLGMGRMTREELATLIDAHKVNPLFASRVIVTAATQFRVIKPRD